jgi:hypothetical protein
VSTRRRRTRLDVPLAAALLAAALATACGKKGPPLPPLLKLPAAPDNFTAARRGDTVALDFTVPNANTDKSRPANVQRVEVYAFTGPTPPTDAELLKRGAKVATVAVKAPRDPNQTIEPDEPPDEVGPIEAPEGPGLDQGSAAHVEDRLDAKAFVPVAPDPDEVRKAKEAKEKEKSAKTKDAKAATPPPAEAILSRTYVGVSINKSGRRGAISKRVTVPLLPPPSAPVAVKATFDEHAVTIAWQPPPASPAADKPATAQSPNGDGAAKPAELPPSTIAYNVYETTKTAGNAAPEIKLTKDPVAETSFSDPRITWGATRCYGVRTVQSFANLAVESDEPVPVCVTLVDTFPPAPPKGLTGIASEGAISLIWDPSDESDLDGYLVLRGLPPGDRLTPITPAIIHETTFRDVVPAGTRYIYAVQAVDKSGNISAASTTVEEAAR